MLEVQVPVSSSEPCSLLECALRLPCNHRYRLPSWLVDCHCDSATAEFKPMYLRTIALSTRAASRSSSPGICQWNNRLHVEWPTYRSRSTRAPAHGATTSFSRHHHCHEETASRPDQNGMPAARRCLATILSYQPKPDFVGTDTVTFTVTLFTSRQVHRHGHDQRVAVSHGGTKNSTTTRNRQCGAQSRRRYAENDAARTKPKAPTATGRPSRLSSLGHARATHRARDRQLRLQKRAGLDQSDPRRRTPSRRRFARSVQDRAAQEQPDTREADRRLAQLRGRKPTKPIGPSCYFAGHGLEVNWHQLI